MTKKNLNINLLLLLVLLLVVFTFVGARQLRHVAFVGLYMVVYY